MFQPSQPFRGRLRSLHFPACVVAQVDLRQAAHALVAQAAVVDLPVLGQLRVEGVSPVFAGLENPFPVEVVVFACAAGGRFALQQSGPTMLPVPASPPSASGSRRGVR